MIVFPETIAAGHFLATRHQVFQHLVDGILVEEPLVDRLGFHAIRHVAVVVPFHGVPLFLLLFGEVVVFDAFPLKFQRHRDRFHRDEKSIFHRFFQRVGVGRHAFFQIEQANRCCDRLRLSESR